MRLIQVGTGPTRQSMVNKGENAHKTGTGLPVFPMQGGWRFKSTEDTVPARVVSFGDGGWRSRRLHVRAVIRNSQVVSSTTEIVNVAMEIHATPTHQF